MSSASARLGQEGPKGLRGGGWAVPRQTLSPAQAPCGPLFPPAQLPRLWPRPSPPTATEEGRGERATLPLPGQPRSSRQGDKAPQITRSQTSLAHQSHRHHEGRGSSSGLCHPPGRPAARWAGSCSGGGWASDAFLPPGSGQGLGGGVVLERPGLGEGQPRLPVLEQRKGCSRAEGLALSPSGKGRGPGGVSVGQTVKLWAGTMAERCLT